MSTVTTGLKSLRVKLPCQHQNVSFGNVLLIMDGKEQGNGSTGFSRNMSGIKLKDEDFSSKISQTNSGLSGFHIPPALKNT